MDNIQVMMTSPDGVVLNTEGKYCGANIEVVPHLQTVSVTPSDKEQTVSVGEGYAGINNVIVAQAEDAYHKLFDEVFHKNGTRENYNNAFNCVDGNPWTWDIICPSCKMMPTTAVAMFYGVKVSSGSIDLAEWFGDKLDFSRCTNTQYCFRDARNVIRVGVLDLRNVVNGSSMFHSSQSKNELETIDLLMFGLGAGLSNMLMFCTNLIHCIFKADSKGSITTTQNFKYQKFDAESVRSIFYYMNDYAGTVTEAQRTLTLTKTAWNNVNADTDNPPPSGNSWQEYAQILGWSYAEAEG